MTISAKTLVNVNPGVLAAGGNATAMIGLALTTNTRVPIGTVAAFPTLASVQSFFGNASNEASGAAVYFAGFDNSSVKPGSLLVAQYPENAVAAYLRGGNISAMPLATLQALTGELDIVIDGYSYAAAALSLSAATSFSSAATIIQSALAAVVPTAASFTASIAATTMSVTAKASGNIAAGQTITGAGVTAGTKILSQISGTTGGIGTYSVSASQTVSSESITATATVPVVTYDSVSGAFVITSGVTGAPSTIAFATNTLAASLLLTAATGAVLSQGAVATTPAAFMNGLVRTTADWASFWLMFNPDNSGNANKLAFAAWTSLQDDEFAFICWDNDITPTTTVPATGSLGYLINQADYSGTCLIYQPTDLYTAAFIAGSIASLDFTETNGRADFAYRSQAGLVAGVTDDLVAANLTANFYNYYGAFASAADGFVQFWNGAVSGSFDWLDSYVNQIEFNSSMQNTLITLLRNVKSIPYNDAGYALISAALNDPINAALNFGTIRAGVTLSAAEITEVNNAAGMPIDSILSTRGWYLQIQDASAAVRAVRGSPPMTLWYTDGESVQQISLASINVQ